MRSRAWCYTINNDTIDDLIGTLDMPTRYICFGFEVGKQGTPHIQGFCYFSDAKTNTTMKKYMPRAHFEACRGSVDDNYTYTGKDEDFYEFGEKPEQGQIGKDRIEQIMNNPWIIFIYTNNIREHMTIYCRKIKRITKGI